jgi:O-antigen ligase
MKFVRFLTVLLLLTACLGQLNRIFVGDFDNVVLYANDFIAAMAAAFYIGHALIVRRSFIIPLPMAWLGGWLLVGLLGLVVALPNLSGQEALVSFFYLLRFITYAALFFVAHDAIVFVHSQQEKTKSAWYWTWILVLSSFLMAVGGFIQLYVLPDLTALAKYGWDPHIGRLVTAMLDPNYAGTYLSLGVAVCLGVLLHVKMRAIYETALLGCLLTLVLAILLTYSRSGYLMLGIVLLVISSLRSRWLLVAGAVVAIVVTLSVPRIQTRLEGAINPDASASLRIVSWQNSWRIAQDNLLLGVGFNSYRYAQDRYGIVTLDQSGNAGAGADSSWIFIVATTGVIGMLFYVAMYASFLWEAWKLYVGQSEPLARGLALGFFSSLIGLAAASMFNNALFFSWILEYWWVMAGIVIGLQYVKPVEHA